LKGGAGDATVLTAETRLLTVAGSSKADGHEGLAQVSSGASMVWSGLQVGLQGTTVTVASHGKTFAGLVAATGTVVMPGPKSVGGGGAIVKEGGASQISLGSRTALSHPVVPGESVFTTFLHVIAHGLTVRLKVHAV
jgi:hypothetical protein